MSGEVKITQAVKDRLVWLETEGKLTPSLVVEDARAENSPLHEMFDWDDASAAAKHRIQQARVIIHSVRVNIVTEHVTIQAPVYIRDPGVGKEQGYISVSQLRADPEQARESVRLEFQRAESALTRARAVAVALNMEDEIDALVISLSGLRERLSEQPSKDQMVA